MPVFTPPEVEDTPRGVPNHPSYRLMRYYRAQKTGMTVWQDQAGAWHSSLNPYQGGDVWRNYDDGQLVSTTGPAEGLATAQSVYLGGHSYPISDLQAVQLMLAGFVVGGHWDTEESRWVTFCINSIVSKEYKGGDSAASVLLADGRSLWVFADNFIGSTTPQGFYNPVLPTRNALMVRAADGTLTQAFPEGNHPAWTDPQAPFHWWPIDIVNDGLGTAGSNYVACWEVNGTLTGNNFGHLVRNEILALSFFSTVASTEELETPTEDFFIQAMAKDDDTGFHYILGLEFDKFAGGYDKYSLTTDTFTRLARCPIGSLGALNANIRYYNQTLDTWGTSSNVPRLRDAQGNVIQGNADMRKVGDTYILLTLPVHAPVLTMYTAPDPTGPWVLFHQTEDLSLDPPGATPFGPSHYAYYLPKFHPELDPNPQHLIATYNRNIFTNPNTSGTPILSTMHCKTFVPQFIFLPSPEP